jgi:DNA polymerase-3 subunit gamma/tau
MLTTEAFNALLKILEEPPAHAIFILATTEPQKVPETVLSRCQRFDFKPINIQEIAKYLLKVAKKEKFSIDKEAALMIAASANGSLRDALGLLDQISVASEDTISAKDVQEILGLVEHRAVVKLVDLIIESDLSQAIKLADRLIGQGIQNGRIIDSINDYLRKLLLVKFEAEKDSNLSREQLSKARKQASQVTQKQLVDWIRTFIESSNNSVDNLPQLSIELALCQIIESDTNSSDTTDFDHDDQQSKKNSKKSSSNHLERELGNKKEEPKKSQRKDPNNQSKSLQNLDKFTKEDMEKIWLEVVDKIKGNKHSLSGILQHCSLVNIDNGKAFLAADRKFYQKRVMDLKNKKLIQESMKKVVNNNLKVVCDLQKNVSMSNNKKEDEEVNKLTAKAEEVFSS